MPGLSIMITERSAEVLSYPCYPVLKVSEGRLLSLLKNMCVKYEIVVKSTRVG